MRFKLNFTNGKTAEVDLTLDGGPPPPGASVYHDDVHWIVGRSEPEWRSDGAKLVQVVELSQQGPPASRRI